MWFADSVLDVSHNISDEKNVCLSERKRVWRWRSQNYNCPLKQIIEVLRTPHVRAENNQAAPQPE